MAVNKATWIRNFFGAKEPLTRLGLFQAGATQAIKRGEILELSGGNWIPLDADQSMAGVIAVADEEIKSGDRAGYYRIIIPRPGDVFEYALAAAGTAAPGTSLYWVDSQTVTVTTGSNILGVAVGDEQIPRQGHAADDASPDQGTTLRSISNVLMTFRAATSYYAVLQT